MRIAYLVMSYLCCGGNRIVFEQANRLTQRGHQLYLITITEEFKPDWFELDERIKLARYADYAQWLDDVDAIVATYNETVWHIVNLPGNFKGFYFVQTDERRFYKDNPEYLGLCEESYRLRDLVLFTEARWVKEILEKEFYREVYFVPNRLNFDHYYPEPVIESKKPVVLVEGNDSVREKGVKDALDAIADLDCEKWLLTNNWGELEDWTRGFDRIWNLPDQKTTRQVISSATVMLKPTHFEGSPLPHMETMACKTALVTTDCEGALEYCRDGLNSLVVPTRDIQAMRAAVERLIKDEAFREKLVEWAFFFARENFRWDDSIDILERMFEKHCGKKEQGIERKIIESKEFLGNFDMDQEPMMEKFVKKQEFILENQTALLKKKDRLADFFEDYILLYNLNYYILKRMNLIGRIVDIRFPTRRIKEDFTVGEYFEAEDHVRKFLFNFKTYGRANYSTLRFTLREESPGGRIIFSRGIDTGEIRVGERFPIMLPHRAIVGGKSYYFEFSSANAHRDNSVSLFCFYSNRLVDRLKNLKRYEKGNAAFGMIDFKTEA